MPAVAVIMPVHNRAATVLRAIDSVVGQDFADFELIVIDDGSTDGSPEIVGSVQDPRVTLIQSETNQGSNAARNRGIQAAGAPLIAFLDSDDVYLSHKLGFVVRVFEERPELDVLVDSFTKEFSTGDNRKSAKRQNPVIDRTDDFVRALFSRRLWKATSAITLRRETAIRAGLFDEALKRRQDFDFLYRASKVGRCASTDEILWVKSWTPGCISDDLGTFADATIELCRRHPAYFANREFRAGLARDVARHFIRLIFARRFPDFGRDARALAREFGWPGLIRLTLAGLWEMLARKLSRRRVRSPNRDQPSARPRSGAVRNRASGRS